MFYQLRDPPMPEKTDQTPSERRANRDDRRENDSDRRIADRIVAEIRPRRENTERRATTIN